MAISRADLKEGKRTPLPYAGQNMYFTENSTNSIIHEAQQASQGMRNIEEVDDDSSLILGSKH